MFTLQELMSIEEQRCDEEQRAREMLEADRRAAAEKARQAAIEAERVALAAAEDRRRQAAAEARDAELRARANEALVAAQAAAVIEKARAEARLEELKAIQAHERSVAEIQAAAAKSKARRALVGVSVGLALLLAGGAGLYFGKIRPDAIAEQDRLSAEQADTRALIQRLTNDLAAKDGQLSDAEKRAAALLGLATAATQDPPADKPVDKPSTPQRPYVRPTNTVVQPPPKDVPCVESDDPLNPCVNGHK